MYSDSSCIVLPVSEVNGDFIWKRLVVAFSTGANPNTMSVSFLLIIETIFFLKKKPLFSQPRVPEERLDRQRRKQFSAVSLLIINIVS